MLQLLVLSLHGFGLYTQKRTFNMSFSSVQAGASTHLAGPEGVKLAGQVPHGGKAAQQPDMMAYAFTLLEKA